MFNLKSNKKNLQDEIGEKIYQDKEKNVLVTEYLDEVRLNDRKTRIEGIGIKIAQINSFFMDYLNAYNIPTCYLKSLENKVYLNNHTKFSFNIRVTNSVDARLAELFDKKEGDSLSIPIFEFLVGHSDCNLVNESHLISFEICNTEEIKVIKRLCSKVNAVLKSFFERRNCFLAEYICSFGKDNDKIMLLNSFTPKYIKINTGSSSNLLINKPSEFRNYIDFMLNLIKQQ